jgi:predicted ribosomally synthesized peptide with SipW-like signal peptide
MGFIGLKITNIMMRIITSLGMIVFAGALVVGGTGAFFSDTETSTANVFTAGAIDLKVDSVGHVNGLVCFNNAWHPESIVVWNAQTSQNELVLNANVPASVAAYNLANPANVPQAGTACASTWAETDLGAQKFFNFADVKPGDEGENTISLHVINNDAYACVDVNITSNDDVSSTDPELESGDTQDGVSEFDGELAQNIEFFAWADDGDNIWESPEPPLFSNISGPASDVLDGETYTLADSNTAPLQAGDVSYIGLAWCAGDLVVNTVNFTYTCDGDAMGNNAQTDELIANIAFRVEQARNNEAFRCVPPPVKVVSSPLNYGPTGWGGWSCPAGTTVVDGSLVVTGGDLATTLAWKPGATTGAFNYPTTPFGYTYGAGETGFIGQNDNDSGESIVLSFDCQPN